MLTLHDRAYRLCDGLTRRELLRIGSVGALGLSAVNLLAARQVQASPPRSDRSFGQARACLILFLTGGPPQHETWDPKPDAPREIRGDLNSIPSSVTGLRVGELMPRTARLAHKIAVLRAMSTGDSAHSSSGYAMLTGRPHTPMNSESARPGAPNDWPCLGAVIQQFRRSRVNLPSAIVLPERIINNPNIPWPGQDAGWLGRTADPWLLTCDPSAPTFQAPELTLPSDLPPLRFDQRRSLLEQVNRHLDHLDRTGALARYDHQSQQVFDLLRSPAVRRAFNLDEEPPRRRDRYSRHKFGQSVLLARRLIEAGVPLVQVNFPREPGDTNSSNPLWDTHQRNTERLRTALMPPMDMSYSSLLEDLDERGLLDSTLVVWMGEFGRTPRINPQAGRDHWGHVFSVALAGGGIRGGVVHGCSDSIGGYPRDGRVTPADLHATIFHCLGIDPHSEIRDPLNRPLAINRGAVIRQVV